MSKTNLRARLIWLLRGQHVVTPRRGYTHHGIGIDGGNVIHYSGLHTAKRKGRVESTSLEDFCSGQLLYVYRYVHRSYSANEAASRAQERLEENNYNLLSNNCEHFVAWCINGDRQSDQVDNAWQRLLNNYIIPGIYGVFRDIWPLADWLALPGESAPGVGPLVPPLSLDSFFRVGSPHSLLNPGEQLLDDLAIYLDNPVAHQNSNNDLFLIEISVDENGK